ncbi:hypothetical protein EDB84DRAFT_782722 [Lactarius hengduanensis]|nr:hypothetical protein EDB84DRAFT_782722 [Lactarius hengduanensis]
MQLPVRSLVGLILYATLTLEPSVVNRFPGFKKRMNWFLENGPEVPGRNMADTARGCGERFLLALASKGRLISIRCSTRASFSVNTAFDPYRSYTMTVRGAWKLTVKDTKSVIGPGSPSLECLVVILTGAAQFGGPLAVNFLLIESLQRFHNTTAMNFR